MTEAEVVEQLVEFTNILLAGVSVLFTVVSAYIAALNYFIGTANFTARAGAFAFVTLILAMLVFVLMGAQATQAGLVARLHELAGRGELTAAGQSILANSAPDQTGGLSIDDAVRLFTWAALGLIYFALYYLTFVHRWRPDAVPVTIRHSDKP
ncbi:MAG: hypothetical protein AB7J28_09105 [Hyphomonadaceae bacterium]